MSFWGARVRLRSSAYLSAAVVFVLFVGAPGPAASHARAAALAFGVVAVYFGSMLVHEIAHVAAAARRGIATRSIELHGLGGAALLEAPPDSPGTMAAIAGAGPAANALLAGAALVLSGWLPADGPAPLSHALVHGSAIQALAVIVLVANADLLVFNILPGLPLDGGQLLRAALWRLHGDGGRAVVWPARLGVALGAAACLKAMATHNGLGVLLAFFGVRMLASASPWLRMSRLVTALRDATVYDALAPEQNVFFDDTPAEEALACFEHFERLGRLVSHVPVITRDASYLGLVRHETLKAGERPPTGPLRAFVTAAEHDPEVRIVTPYELLTPHLVTGPLMFTGALVAIDHFRRYRGILYCTGVGRALARSDAPQLVPLA